MTTTPIASSPAPAAVDARHEEGPVERRVSKGPRLYFTSTTPNTPRIAVALLHGFADYGGRYAHVAAEWATRGIATVTLDMRGHGRSEGARGYCDRFGDYLDDTSELVDLLARRHAALPAFIFGHSFGGLVAASFVLRSPGSFRGVVLSAPGFRFAVHVPWYKRLAGQVASRVMPGFGLPSGLHGSDLTHDAALAKAYDADPLSFGNARARWFTEALAAQASAMERARQFDLPLYLAMGTEDRVNDFAQAKRFFETCGSKDKTLVPCDGLFHEILNEPSWRTTAGSMADWMLARA